MEGLGCSPEMTGGGLLPDEPLLQLPPELLLALALPPPETEHSTPLLGMSPPPDKKFLKNESSNPLCLFS